MLGLYHCGKSELWQEILERVEEYYIGEDLDVSYDEETVACSLAEPVLIRDVQGSVMLRELAILTRMVQNASREGQ